MTPIPSQLITGLILAGGLSTRMGNVNKGLQPLYGKTMLAHVIDCLTPQVGSLMISVNHDLNAYAPFEKPLVQDIVSDYAGPLAGIHAGLMQCTTPYLFCAPCDVPLLPFNVVEKLAQALSQCDADIAVACTKEFAQMHNPIGAVGSVGSVDSSTATIIKSHPIICLMKTSFRHHIDQFLQQGGRKVQAWQAELKTQQVIFDNAAAFYNFNHTEELLLANNHQQP